MSAFKSTQLAADHYSADFSLGNYLERTKRNHFWLGGVQGQLKLKSLRVGIAGLGGMGGGIAAALVRLGVGHLKIADPDRVELSNLNRQIVARSTNVGLSKLEEMTKELRLISQDFELVTYPQGITPDNVQEFVQDLDVVIDEIDVFPLSAHLLLHRAAQDHKLPIYSCYVVGLGVHLYKFHGDEFTFEDFLGTEKDMIHHPSGQFLLDRFGAPLPSYLRSGPRLSDFHQELSHGRVPIFGASCLLGHAMVPIRVVVDCLGLSESLKIPRTPTMPKFLVLDPLDFEFQLTQRAGSCVS